MIAGLTNLILNNFAWWYAPVNAGEILKNSIYLQTHALSLPLYSDMKEEEAGLVCSALERLHNHSYTVTNKGIAGK